MLRDEPVQRKQLHPFFKHLKCMFLYTEIVKWFQQHWKGLKCSVPTPASLTWKKRFDVVESVLYPPSLCVHEYTDTDRQRDIIFET